MEIKAKVHEIFTSVQGEGVFSGKRQIFVRFFGCRTGCAFCDTHQDSESVKEYLSADLLSVIHIKAHPAAVHSVSLTGGEPLLWVNFLKEFLPKLKQDQYKVYLETNGILYRELAEIIDYVDIIAMDIKLPSSTQKQAFWEEHSEFLNISMKKQVFVKIIVTGKTTASDFSKAVLLVSRKNPYIALVIQPVTPAEGVPPVSETGLKQFRTIALEHLHKVKIIPQMHKLYGIR
jgi:organic radical activating enzyme